MIGHSVHKFLLFWINIEIKLLFLLNWVYLFLFRRHWHRLNQSIWVNSQSTYLITVSITSIIRYTVHWSLFTFIYKNLFRFFLISLICVIITRCRKTFFFLITKQIDRNLIIPSTQLILHFQRLLWLQRNHRVQHIVLLTNRVSLICGTHIS